MKCLFKSFARFSLGLLVLLLLNLMGAFETHNMPPQVRWLQRRVKLCLGTQALVDHLSVDLEREDRSGEPL